MFGRPQWGVWCVVGAWLVSVSSVWFAAVRRVSSSAVPLGSLLWRCVGGGLRLGGSSEGAEHAGSGWLRGGGTRACVGLYCDLRFFGLWCPRRVCPLLPPRFSPLPFPFPSLFPCSFFFGGGCGWGTAFAVLGGGVGACRCWCWCGRGCLGGWWMGGCCALESLCVSRLSGIRWLFNFGAQFRGALAVGGRRQWWCGACVATFGSRVAPGWCRRTRACVWVCSWRGPIR